MDLSTIMGIILGLVLIVVAIVTEDSLLTFWSFSSILVVLGGVIAATLIHYPLARVLSIFKVLQIAFRENLQDPVRIIRTLVSMAEIARRDGLLALETEAQKETDAFLRRGLELIIDGTDPELVRDIMETELEMTEDRHRLGAGVLEFMGSCAPAFGMLGTLIGLIMMLKKLNDPNSLGPGMALALITTFYGLVLANLVFIPLAGKLKLRSNEESLIKGIIIEGVLSIQAGENPRIVKEKMKAFLLPEDQERVEKIRREVEPE